MNLIRSTKQNIINQLIYLSVCLIRFVTADNYEVSPEYDSLLVAVGCFWCGEQAFEQYAPGVIEAISGYAGGMNENPTYYNHPGHYEVVLIEYDPALTSYEVLLHYTWRNLDPFNGNGQFCDRGTSYKPAIFYSGEEEREIAEKVYDEILIQNPSWDSDKIAVELIDRPTFWIAEDYHQDYYIKKPKNYGYYKNACGRTSRLKEVWGEDVYKCYHSLETNTTCDNMVITNKNGMKVDAEVNVKQAPEPEAGLLPTSIIIIISLFVASLVLLCGFVFYTRRSKGSSSST